MLVRCALILMVSLAASVACAAQKSEAAASPAAEFSKVSNEFKAQVAKLAQLRKRYQSDPNADKKALEREWEDKLVELRALEPKVAAAAEKAYLAAPEETGEAHEYVFNHLTTLLQKDDYDDGMRLAKVLADNKYQHAYFNLLAGLAFFGGMDFDDAKKYLTLAKEQNETDANGRRYLDMIDRHNYVELWQKEQAIRAAEEKAGNLPKVKLTTDEGDIVIELFENEAPIATANFINLVEKKFYDGLKFHRVIQGFMAQGGDPKGDGKGGPGYTIPDECYQDNHRNHFRGSLSMANNGQRDSGGSQFFLTFLPTAHLDGKHTVFGRVVEGMDVLSKLQRCEPGGSETPDKILKATVLSKRPHKYEAVKRAEKK